MSDFTPVGYTPQAPAVVVASRDPLQSFSKPMWQRFFKHAGALRANAQVYDTVRQLLVTHIHPVLEMAALQTNVKGCKTIDEQMVRVALGKLSRITETVTLPPDVQFPATPFDRMARTIINEYKPDTRVSSTASKLLKESYEKIMLSLIKRAVANAAKAKRATLSPQDFK